MECSLGLGVASVPVDVCLAISEIHFRSDEIRSLELVAGDAMMVSFFVYKCHSWW